MNESMKTSECSRRHFFTKLSMTLAGIAGAFVAIPVIGSFIAPLFKRPAPVWRPVGNLDSFKVGQFVKVSFEDNSPLPWAGVTAESAAWIRRDDQDSFRVFSVNCAHLGCPVRWVPAAKLFMWLIREKRTQGYVKLKRLSISKHADMNFLLSMKW